MSNSQERRPENREEAIKRLQQAAVEWKKEQTSEAFRRLEQCLWDALVSFSGYPFRTAKGLDFTYAVRGNEMFVSRKEKSITRATVDMSLKKALELDCHVTGPKRLGTFGASYLYPVFIHIGLI